MARKAANFDWDEHPTGRTQYPWNKWLNPDSDETWIIEQGEDFTCEVTSIKSLISSTAKKRGVEVMVTDFEEDGDVLVAFKVTGVAPEDDDEAPKAEASDDSETDERASVFASA